MTTVTTADAAAPRGGRIPALDGLRGVAALVVLVHHSLMATPALSAPYYADASASPVTPLDALIFTPLHLVWAGTEAVYVFFILSGVVLVLPVLRSSRFTWRSYYPSRLIRLYLPCLGALVVAVALAELVPRVAAHAKGAWDLIHVAPTTLTEIAHAAVLVDGATPLDTPYWSLQFEVLFSLLLPLYVVVAVWTRRASWATVVAVLLLVLVGTVTQDPFLTYLPMFLIGAVLATRIDGLAARLRRLPTPMWIGILALAIGSVTSLWWLDRLGTLVEMRQLTIVPTVCGAGLFVLMAIGWPAAGRVLAGRVCRWLGRISFSLYLVHEPIVVTFAFLLPAGLTWLVPVVAIPVALLAGAVFFRIVEGPSHRLAQAVARRLRVPDPARVAN